MEGHMPSSRARELPTAKWLEPRAKGSMEEEDEMRFWGQSGAWSLKGPRDQVKDFELCAKNVFPEHMLRFVLWKAPNGSNRDKDPQEIPQIPS
jgi:hypothetical protein